MRVLPKWIFFGGAVLLLPAAGWFLRDRIASGKTEAPASASQPGNEPVELTDDTDSRMRDEGMQVWHMRSLAPQPLNGAFANQNIVELDYSIEEAPIEGIDAVALLYYRGTGGPAETMHLRPGRFWGLRVRFRESGRFFLLIYDYSAPPRDWVIKAITIFRNFKVPPPK